jgi:DMSO/TMAO reductase YedYZ molybdopterin-dependent catalytic subunit
MVLGSVSALAMSGLSYLGSRLFGLPFIAFNLLDTITRLIPRLMVLVGLDQLMQGQETATPNLGALSAVSQPLLAVLLVVLVGLLFGLALRAMGRREEKPFRLIGFGLAGGLVLWVLFAVINRYLGFPSAGPLGSLVFLAGLCLVWGGGLGWMIHWVLFSSPAAAETNQDRRRFMALAGSIATAVAAAGLGWLIPRQEPAPAKVDSPDGGEPLFKADASDQPPGLEDLAIEATSGPAASPSLEALQARPAPAPGTRPEVTSVRDFYNIDINTNPPVIDGADWRLELRGLVDQPMILTLNDLRAYPAVSQMVTMSCISNTVGGSLISTALWTGMRLKDLLADAGLRSGARELYIEAADGFFESISMADIEDPRTLLVYEMNGAPLAYEHGYPLRIYIPNRFGMKQPKWIVSMEAVDEEGPGYWVERGWSAEAIARTTSVFDTAVNQPDQDRVVLGGIAWAGERGIRKVEVRVDGGEWAEATLIAPPLSPLTWVQWRYDWPSVSGSHTAEVRAIDGTGEVQELTETGRRPDGATGVDQIEFEV